MVSVNQYLWTLAQSRKDQGVVWFDGFAIIADEQGRMKADYRKDELHLNQNGYVALNEALVSKLPNPQKKAAGNPKTFRA